MLSRRTFVGRLAAGAAVAWAAALGRAEAVSTGTRVSPSGGSGNPDDQLALAPHIPRESSPEPQELLTEVAQPAPEVARAEAGASLSAPPPWELFRPLALGSVVAHGWRVGELSQVVDGSCVLTLQNERGRTHRVHLCRNDGRPQGLVYTNRLDLVVMNGGQGDLPTEEGLGQAVAEVAHVVAANEGGRRHREVVASLLPHAERVRLFAAAADARLR